MLGLKLNHVSKRGYWYLFIKRWHYLLPKLEKTQTLRLGVNSLLDSVAIWRHVPRFLLIQVMVCRLFSAKPLSELVMIYCQLDSYSFHGNRLKTKTFAFKKKLLKMTPPMSTILFRAQCVKMISSLHNWICASTADSRMISWLAISRLRDIAKCSVKMPLPVGIEALNTSSGLREIRPMFDTHVLWNYMHIAF